MKRFHMGYGLAVLVCAVASTPTWAGGTLTYAPVKVTTPPTPLPNFSVKLVPDRTTVPVNGTVILRATNNAGVGTATDQDWYYLDGQEGVPDRNGSLEGQLEFIWNDDVPLDEYGYYQSGFSDPRGPVTIWYAPPAPGVYTLILEVYDTGYVREEMTYGHYEWRYQPATLDLPASQTNRYTATIEVVPMWTTPWYSWPDIDVQGITPLTLYSGAGSPSGPGYHDYYVASPGTTVNLKVRKTGSTTLPPNDADNLWNEATQTSETKPDALMPTRWSLWTSNDIVRYQSGSNNGTDYNLTIPTYAKWTAVDAYVDDNPNFPNGYIADRDDWSNWVFRDLIVNKIDVSSPPETSAKTAYKPAPTTPSEPPTNGYAYVEVSLSADGWWKSATRDIKWVIFPATPIVNLTTGPVNDNPVALFFRKDTSQNPPVYTSVSPAAARGGNNALVVVWSGLPVLNTTFNQIKLQAKLQTLPPVQRQMALFFDPTATDHPHGATLPAGLVEPPNVEWPNWLYYWKQTSANYAPYGYVYWPQGWPDREAECASQFVPGVGWQFEIRLGPDLCETYSGWNDTPYQGKVWKSIDHFGMTVRHEAQHAAMTVSLWPNGYNPAQDFDGDYVPDWYEQQNRNTYAAQHLILDWTLADSDPPVGLFDDEEELCQATQLIDRPWNAGAGKAQDWSKEGEKWASMP